jgi:hypothetical protein
MSINNNVYEYITNTSDVDFNYLYKMEITQKKIKRGGNTTKKHKFIPVRFIAFHSELDKVAMSNSLEKFNSPDNSDGYRIMIIIGGKLIKEAFDIKAIRELMVLGRPDNIPTLIQIFGRAVRKHSHRYLTDDKKNVNIRIFTSCLPEKNKKTHTYEMSVEEIKYAEKIGHYKIIQNIEKTLHENAIDSIINRDIIWANEENKFYTPELGSLYYKPNLSQKINDINSLTLDELNLSTFNAFHINTEIDNIMIIIKMLFIDISPVWNYDDLLSAVKKSNEYFQLEFNTTLINNEAFIVALSRLLWFNDNEYIEPIVKGQFQINNIIDKIFNSDDKIIILPNNQKSAITQVGQHYILFPLDVTTNTPLKIAELPYRNIKPEKPTYINVKHLLEKRGSISNYNEKRDKFFIKWNNVDIEKLETAVCDFGIDFHIKFLEEAIEYVFNVWTDTKIKKSNMHSFYFKMVNYYDLRGLVIWGNTIKSNYFKPYSNILQIYPVKINNDTYNEKEKINENVDSSGLINLLKTSINRVDINWVSTGLKDRYNDNVNQSLKLFDGKYKKPIQGKKQKIDASLIPVGHYMDTNPRFYHPVDKWITNQQYIDTTNEYIENDDIIGYDERSKMSIQIKFKVRPPIQKIKQHKDTRFLEKGSICSSKSKPYLHNVAKKLNIKINGKVNITNLCSSIRTHLIYLELKERQINSNKKYFYFIYEKRPDMI